MEGRIATGSETLDRALGGGVPLGVSVLVEGPQGVGSTEFALTLLRRLAATRKGRAVFATALRAPARAKREAGDLFGDDTASGIEFVELRPAQAAADLEATLAGLARGDALVVESLAALARAGDDGALLALVEAVGDATARNGATALLLHAPGTLSARLESAVAEVADGVFTFGWRDGGPNKRRLLVVTKLRGLAPALDGENVPVFELQLRAGVGFTVSSFKAVV